MQVSLRFTLMLAVLHVLTEAYVYVLFTCTPHTHTHTHVHTHTHTRTHTHTHIHTHTHTHTRSQVKLYNEKRSDLEEQQLHLNVGLQKIRETVDQVEELQASLSIKKNELEQKNTLANQKLKQMVST